MNASFHLPGDALAGGPGIRHHLEANEFESPGPVLAGGNPAPGAPVMSFGVDTASVDGNHHADWGRARREGGIRFAIIRSNWGVYEDPVFRLEWPRLKDAGLVRGAYLFLRFGKERGLDPVAQAKALIRSVGPLTPGDLPPSLDVEFPGGRAKTGLTARQCLEAARAAWRVLKDHYGVAPILYTSARVWHEDLGDLPAPDLAESPLWAVRYPYAKGPFVRDAKAFAGGRLDPRVPLPWGDAGNWWIHQYQGDARGLPGLRQADMNRFNPMLAGAKGGRVRWVQRRLGVAETGVLDAGTLAALRGFQQTNGLAGRDGVDLSTFAALCWMRPVRRAGVVGENEGAWHEVRLGEEAEAVSATSETGLDGEDEGEMEQEGPTGGLRPVRARILWPALGFPAVVTPGQRPSGATLREGDATRCVSVLLLSDQPTLTAAQAARYLRCVPWGQRGRRHIATGSFAAADLVVRNDVGSARLSLPGRKDSLGEQVRFGENAQGQHGVVAYLAERVRGLYRSAGLAHLHEIRLSEVATARLQEGRYHLFWNNASPGEQAFSDEMQLLLSRHARPQRARLGPAWEKEREFLVREYAFEYGGLHAPYNQGQGRKPVPAEILHPLFIRRRVEASLRVGHVTDTHVDVRPDVYEHNLRAARVRRELAGDKGSFNNPNTSFVRVYADAREHSDVILMTGDLIDYGRGHWGLGRPNQLQEDSAYHADRNWFLFYDLLAAGNSYEKPVYTILGNHDWRLNPYPPFSPGATKPNEMLHDHLQLAPAEQRRILQLAHGPGHQRAYAYSVKAENTWQLLKQKTGSTLKTLGKLIAQTKSLDVPGYPTETSVESIAWYLLAINPFLDYAFTLPGRQSVLMLDWAKTEQVLFDDVIQGQKWGYDPLDPGSAAGTPKASSCLTPLQQRLVLDFNNGPSPAKIVGVHAPPISPYWDWHDPDLLAGRKTYANPRTARGPSGGHPLFAIRPEGAPHGMVGERGSLVRGRDTFIRLFAQPRSAVRLVLSGHVHRNGLYVVHPSSREIYVKTAKDIVKEWRLKDALLMRGVVPQAVRAARPPAVTVTPEGGHGPLYVTTTSAGPRGSFEERPLAGRELQTGRTTDPGWGLMEIAGDGTLRSVQFRAVRPAAVARVPAPVVQREEALAVW